MRWNYNNSAYIHIYLIVWSKLLVQGQFSMRWILVETCQSIPKFVWSTTIKTRDNFPQFDWCSKTQTDHNNDGTIKYIMSMHKSPSKHQTIMSESTAVAGIKLGNNDCMLQCILGIHRPSTISNIVQHEALCSDESGEYRWSLCY